jgi:hypothetical protein
MKTVLILFYRDREVGVALNLSLDQGGNRFGLACLHGFFLRNSGVLS